MELDSVKSAPAFVALTLGSIVAGLLAGGLIDASVRKMQASGATGEKVATQPWQERAYGRAVTFFLVQCMVNIATLLALVRLFPRFQAWFQLSISGALFSVVLFSVQRNLGDNALRITSTP